METIKKLSNFVWRLVKKVSSSVWDFIKRYPELLTIPAGFVLWVLSIYVLRAFDPTAGVFDAGVFQIPLFAIIQLLIYVSIAWFVFRIIFGTFYKYIKNYMKHDFYYLTGWQKIVITYLVFLSLVFLLAFLARTLVAG